MGTNFYARIIPTKERKEKLKELIDQDDFREIENAVSDMYGAVGEYHFMEGGEVHLGKRSGGWKFLWNPNWYEYDGGHYDLEQKKWIPKPMVKKYYELNRESIREFLLREDVRVFDEYGEEYDAEAFMKEMEEWDNTPWINGKPKFDGKTYDEMEKENGSPTAYDRYGDPHEKKWRRLGFEPCHHDFYSDGMRFSTSTDFS